MHPAPIDKLQHLIIDFSNEHLIEFIRSRTGAFSLIHEDYSQIAHILDERFSDLRQIGVIEYENGEKLQITTCKFNDILSKRAAKKAQFDTAKNILKDDFKDGAIFVFYDNDGRFRFSFIRKNWGIKGEGKYTPWKRYTFFVDKTTQSNRTFRNRIDVCQFGSLDEVQTAFKVEPLSDAFFEEYKKQYGELCGYLTGKHFVKSGSAWREADYHSHEPDLAQFRELFGNDAKRVRDYIKKLLGRLVFLKFLERKGWLNGDNDFLQNLFDNSVDQDDFLDSALNPLFFEILNTKKEERQSDNLNPVFGERVDIPYLNGGLFDNDDTDRQRVMFPSRYFKNIFEFFNRYNFTIDENDPNDAEVGIDPEMLGRIFENLLEDNKDKGAFYTPKEIVQYMCQESLIQYLQTHLGESEELSEFIRTGQATEFVRKHAPKINELLDSVKICDPAVGSGAFPMGLLQEILRAKIELNLAHNDKITDFKEHIIQNSIYGVDIEQGAVDIARLRFWLSLVVDSEEQKPLPNLDYKIMQGNSLLESFMGIDLSKFSDRTEQQFDMWLTLFEVEGTQKAIMELIDEYFAVTDHEEKRDIRHKIDNKVKNHIVKYTNNNPEVVAAVEQLKEGNMPFFLWHVYFSDVFERGGFDIVIANPPYVVVRRGTYTGYNWNTDLYLLFFELALFKIMKHNAVLSFITPKFYLINLTNADQREYFLTKTCIHHLVETDPFDAVTENVITTLSNSIPKSTFIKVYKEQDGEFLDKNIIEIAYCLENPNKEIVLSLQPTTIKILDKIKSDTQPLGEISKSKRGAEISNKIIKRYDNGRPVLIGEDVQKYSIHWGSHYIDPDHKEVRRLSNFFLNNNIVYLRRVGEGLIAAINNEKFLCNKNLYGISINNNFSKNYIVALLNSKMLDFYYKQRFTTKKEEAFPEIQKYLFEALPIKIIENQQSYIDLVDKILETKCQNPTADISTIENRIDFLVYKLYGLTYDEICTIDPKTLITKQQYENE